MRGCGGQNGASMEPVSGWEPNRCKSKYLGVHGDQPDRAPPLHQPKRFTGRRFAERAQFRSALVSLDPCSWRNGWA